MSAAEFDQVPSEAVAAGTDRLLGTEGVVPRNPLVTRQEWDAIMAQDLAAGTVRGEGAFEDMVDMSFAQAATDALANSN